MRKRFHERGIAMTEIIVGSFILTLAAASFTRFIGHQTVSAQQIRSRMMRDVIAERLTDIGTSPRAIAASMVKPGANQLQACVTTGNQCISGTPLRLYSSIDGMVAGANPVAGPLGMGGANRVFYNLRGEICNGTPDCVFWAETSYTVACTPAGVNQCVFDDNMHIIVNVRVSGGIDKGATGQTIFSLSGVPTIQMNTEPVPAWRIRGETRGAVTPTATPAPTPQSCTAPGSFVGSIGPGNAIVCITATPTGTVTVIPTPLPAFTPCPAGQIIQRYGPDASGKPTVTCTAIPSKFQPGPNGTTTVSQVTNPTGGPACSLSIGFSNLKRVGATACCPGGYSALNGEIACSDSAAYGLVTDSYATNTSCWSATCCRWPDGNNNGPNYSYPTLTVNCIKN